MKIKITSETKTHLNRILEWIADNYGFRLNLQKTAQFVIFTASIPKYRNRYDIATNHSINKSHNYCYTVDVSKLPLFKLRMMIQTLKITPCYEVLFAILVKARAYSLPKVQPFYKLTKFNMNTISQDKDYSRILPKGRADYYLEHFSERF